MGVGWVGVSLQIINLQTELKYLDYFKYYWTLTDSRGPPVEGWVDRGGGWWEGAPTHMHTHAHAHTCTCTHMHAQVRAYDIIGNSQGFPKNPMEAVICMKLSCLPRAHVCACACVHARACAHVWGVPQTTLHPHPPTPHPQSCREPKTPKFNVLN